MPSFPNHPLPTAPGAGAPVCTRAEDKGDSSNRSVAASLEEEGERLEADAWSLGCHALEAGLGLVSVRRHHGRKAEEGHGRNLVRKTLGSMESDWSTQRARARGLVEKCRPDR